MSRALVVLSVLAIALCLASPAKATPIVVDQWYEFYFTAPGAPATGCSPADPLGGSCVPGVGSVFAGTPRWTITLTQPAYFEITDAWLRGDSFAAYDGPGLILTTPPVASVGSCAVNNDPEVCRLDPLMSHGYVALAPGLHEFSIVAVNSPFGGGAAFFRVASDIPEPGTLLLLAGGLFGLGLMRRRWK